MTTAEVPESTTNLAPEPGAALGRPPMELLGLLVALMGVGYLLAATLTAYDVASRNGDAGFGVYEGVESGIDLEAFLWAATGAMTFQISLLLVVALVLASGRRYADASRAGQVAAWILFPLGIVVSLGATYTAVKYLTLPEETDGSGISLGVTSWTSRVGPALSYGSGAVAAMYVAWCAFRRLPIAASTGPSEVDEPDDQVESDAVVDAEET